MQEQGPQPIDEPFQHSHKSKFQPIIPIPKVPKPEQVREILPSPKNRPYIFLSDRTINQQLEMYKKECEKLSVENEELQNALTILYNQKSALQSRLSSFNGQKSENCQKKKRFRRPANEIKRIYDCPVEKCGKNYGTDASLVQHIKIKHNEYYSSSEFEALIQKIRNKGNNSQSNSREPLGILTQNFQIGSNIQQ